MQWAISKRSCAAMRLNEMRRDPKFKRHGIRSTGQELVAAKHRRPAESLFRSIGYKRFNFETSAPRLAQVLLVYAAHSLSLYIYIYTYTIMYCI